MATTKVWKVDNQLRIETNGKTTYGNAAWFAIADFSNTNVTLMYMGRTAVLYDIKINFTDFQNNLGISYNTEATIANYLAPLIG